MKLPRTTGERVVKALRAAGFEVIGIRSSHHYLYHAHRDVIVTPRAFREDSCTQDAPGDSLPGRDHRRRVPDTPVAILQPGRFCRVLH